MLHRRFLTMVVSCVAVLGFVVAVTLTGGGATTGSDHSPAVTASATPALTSFGNALRNFEALLRQEFGNGFVCSIATKPGTAINFPRNEGCVPLATYNPYFYVFAKPGKSAFHLTSVKYRAGEQVAGNYPVPILIGGRLVACNRANTTVLIEYSDAAGFALGCVVSPILK
jgi:hypothetical protein